MKHLCEQAGLEEDYKNACVEDFKFLNKEGLCVAEIEETEKYGKQIRIKDYCDKDVKFEAFESDSIPF